MTLGFVLEGVVIGLAVGSIYALIALGFALLYKSTKILNLAHGELVLAEIEGWPGGRCREFRIGAHAPTA